MTEGARKSMIHTEKTPLITGNTGHLLPPCFLDQKEPLFPGRDSISPAAVNDKRWYRIISEYWPYPLLAAAKINRPGLSQDSAYSK